MYSLQERTFSKEDGRAAVQLARDALETYVEQGRRVDLGSMSDLFYTRTGVLLRIESGNRNRLRGLAGVYESTDQLGDAIVTAAIQAAGPSTGGSAVQSPELSNLRISLALVSKVRITATPEETLKPARHCPIVNGDGDPEWLHPSIALDQNWTAEDYLSRTCRKANLSPTAWEDQENHITLFEFTLFEESSPAGAVVPVTPEDE